MKRKKLYIAILLLAGVLTSCKVGKSYVRPDLHLPDSLERSQDSVSFGDQDWRDIYTDATLRSLIERALDHNKDMLIAAARVKEMAAQKRISTAALLPDIKGKVTGEKEVPVLFEEADGVYLKLQEMLSRDRIPLKHNSSFRGKSIFGEICVGRVRPALPSICNLLKHNVHCR